MKTFRALKTFAAHNVLPIFGGAVAVSALATGAWMYSFQKEQPAFMAEGGIKVFKGGLSQEERFLRYAGSLPNTHAGDTPTGAPGLTMTLEEFIASTQVPGGLPPQSEAKHFAALSKVFHTLDTNGDGLLSFDEYCALFCFLSTDDDNFRTAFTMFDVNENGSLDASEFKLMLRALNPDPSSVPLNTSTQENKNPSSLLHHFFGPKLDRNISYETFDKLVLDLRKAVHEAEFEILDFKNTGELDATDLRRLMFDKLNKIKEEGQPASRAESMAEWLKLRNTARRANYREGDEHLTATKKTYLKFCEIIRCSEKIQRAMKLYIYHKQQASQDTNDGHEENVVGLNKEEFLRAVHIGIEGKVQLTPREMELFFAVFDGDMNGTIDLNEFNELCRLNQSFGSGFYRDFTTPHRTRLQQFVSCMMQQ